MFSIITRIIILKVFHFNICADYRQLTIIVFRRGVVLLEIGYWELEILFSISPNSASEEEVADTSSNY